MLATAGQIVMLVQLVTKEQVSSVPPDARFVLKALTDHPLLGMETPVYHATQDTAPRAKELLDLMLPLVRYVHRATVAQVAPLLV